MAKNSLAKWHGWSRLNRGLAFYLLSCHNDYIIIKVQLIDHFCHIKSTGYNCQDRHTHRHTSLWFMAHQQSLNWTSPFHFCTLTWECIPAMWNVHTLTSDKTTACGCACANNVCDGRFNANLAITNYLDISSHRSSRQWLSPPCYLLLAFLLHCNRGPGYNRGQAVIYECDWRGCTPWKPGAEERERRNGNKGRLHIRWMMREKRQKQNCRRQKDLEHKEQ